MGDRLSPINAPRKMLKKSKLCINIFEKPQDNRSLDRVADKKYFIYKKFKKIQQNKSKTKLSAHTQLLLNKLGKSINKKIK